MSAIAYARSLMLVLMLMSMLMSHASVDLFVLSFVLPCAYAYVASENQALLLEFVCSHVYSQHGVVNDCKSTVPFKFLQLKLFFNSHMGLDLCFELINGSLI